MSLAMLSLVIGCTSSSIQVNIEDSRTEYGSATVRELKLYRNDSLIRIIDPVQRNRHVIDSLRSGNYRIEYTSIFKKTESVYVKIRKGKKYYVDLFVDYINHELETYNPIINRLKDGESFPIVFSSRGCFHYSTEKMKIRRESDKYFVEYKDKEKMLNDEDIEAIQHFEIELNYMNYSGCTTKDTYKIFYKTILVMVSDGSCRWRGLYYLKKKLNLIEDKRKKHLPKDLSSLYNPK